MPLCEPASQNIAAIFYRQADAKPGRLAIRESATAWSYGMLAERVDSWRGALQARSLGKEARVAISLTSVADTAALMLACLAEGAIYTILDKTLPAERLRAVTGHVEPDAGAFDETAPPGIAPLVCGAPAKRKEPQASPGLAYIAYTSGTTGVPKGVLQTQPNIAHEVRTHAATLNLWPEDRLSGFYSLATVGAVRDLYGALLTGASYHPFPVRNRRWGELSAHVRENALTLLHFVPSVFRAWAASLTRGETFPLVHTLFLAGEAVRPADVESARAHLPNARFYTGLGASETSSIYVHGFVSAGQSWPGGILPSGLPAEKTRVFLVDPETRKPLAQASPGAVGAIAVASPFLSPGYWKDPGLGASAFGVTRWGERFYYTGDLGRFDAQGRLSHLGRVDRQLKINGIRIEPAEIEHALRSQPGIRDVYIKAATANDRPALVAYVVGEPGATDEPKLRATLEPLLPPSHLPSRFIPLEALPWNRNGKVDDAALPDPFLAPADVAQTSAVEALFRTLLPGVRLSRDTDFRALGGDSLALVQLATELERRHGLSLTHREEELSIHALERRIAALEGAKPSCWPPEIVMLAAQWPHPEGAIPAACFPGYRLPGPGPEAPILLWLGQNCDDYLLPAILRKRCEVWSLPSGYCVLPTDRDATQAWMEPAARSFAGRLEGRRVVVGGFCGSGTLAVLFASLLLGHRTKVEAVLALDSLGSAAAYRRYYLGCLGWKRLRHDLAGAGPEKWIALVSRKWHSLRNRLQTAQTTRPQAAPEYRFGLEETPEWHGPLHLVVSQSTRRWKFLFPRFGWRKQRVPDLRIRTVAGDHSSFLQQHQEQFFDDIFRADTPGTL